MTNKVIYRSTNQLNGLVGPMQVQPGVPFKSRLFPDDDFVINDEFRDSA